MSFKSLPNFLADESGAVTVDWVVLTAALVGLGLAVMSVVSGGLEDLSGDINSQLEADHITDAFSD
ncbi:Flp family type IVb pilin [Alterinioella nitratireducens]|jgi:Flp pilus assembly pilin Flp|uniref:Flp family type IVb pilin n=1 Tax=Alterinioella nitratireducens TaxID=2735915 RepID=UPI000C42435B|nr:pilus assembly protein [Alterinioella nitratireducens]MAX74892.1 pilus assembly protein [Nioella sp.]NPD19511.1 pilus assembly protein [Alterinioella nitratireducens]|tara:strand:+ start:1616 stop:1813 length:198 start_codon:yes stop_codon:yes gene_type:complete